MSSVVRISVLGPMVVSVDGVPVEVDPRRQRAVLARLVLAAGRVVSTDRLVEDLWDAEPRPKHLPHYRCTCRTCDVFSNHTAGRVARPGSLSVSPRVTAFDYHLRQWTPGSSSSWSERPPPAATPPNDANCSRRRWPAGVGMPSAR